MKIYSGRYQSYREDTIFIRKISKGNNSVKNVGGVLVHGLCTSSVMMVYISTIRVIERTRKVNGRTDGRLDRRTGRQTNGRRARHNTTRLRRAYKIAHGHIELLPQTEKKINLSSNVGNSI